MRLEMKNCKILLVDDEQQILEMETSYLKRSGFNNLLTASTCSDTLMVVKQQQPDLIVLDVMLPDGNGFSLFKGIKMICDSPILFLSARDEDMDRLIGLGLGADDYITKPFLPEELLLRITNILRRTYKGTSTQEVITLGNRQIDMPGNRIITLNGDISMTAKEYKILEILLENRGRIVTIDALCAAVWEEENFAYENTLMVHIRRLREKLEDDPSHPKWILTVRGLGYKLAKPD